MPSATCRLYAPGADGLHSIVQVETNNVGMGHADVLVQFGALRT
ncbi:hypothetical protein AB0D27_42860 [Streptomyces sp. NPDC048415]